MVKKVEPVDSNVVIAKIKSLKSILQSVVLTGALVLL